LKECYAEFQCEHGYLTYDDCIVFAQRCLETDEAKAFYGKKPLYILLDEAQDTDCAQFRFLQTLIALHPHNHFSMVGDPQQSIYSTRADVRDYLELHRSLVQSKRCEELVFSETFRCPPTVVSELNARFPKIFNDTKQVKYVPLHSSVVGDGCVKEIAVAYDDTEEKIAKEEAVALEARVLSNFLTVYLQQYPRDLSDICILSPRNEWLRELKDPLEAFGWKLQLHSEQATGRDNALFCNALAAIHGINFPQDTFEEAGLLRETFGCSDEALAYVFNGDRMHPTNNAEPLEGDYSEERGQGASATDDLFGMQSSYALGRQENFAMPADVYGKISSENVLRFPLNAHVTDKVKAAQDVRRRWRQMLKGISEQSLCAGTVRLIEFFKAFVPPMPTDMYFEEILLEAAFQTQQVGQSWLALERRLRAHLNEKAETEEEIQLEALQGFSCHKAKGLEWKTVIMPFFDRPDRLPPPNYPFGYRGQILWDKRDFKDFDIASDRRRERQRLLYVACTRTKEDLFLMRDAALWGKRDVGVSLGDLYDASCEV
jgi:ATP-dependent exoDNAse (exonuclease V) beta subunit